MDIYLDPATNDIDIFNGQMRLTDKVEDLVRQRTEVNLKTFKGECFWDITAGIPYLANDNNPQQLLGKTANKGLLDASIQDGIVSRQGIVRLISYESVWDKNNRTLTISFSGETEHGDIVSFNNIELEI